MASIAVFPVGGKLFSCLPQDLIKSQKQRGPLQHICSMMRKGGADWVLREDRIETRPGFADQYESAHEELQDLARQFTECRITVTQISFFDLRERRAVSASAYVGTLSSTDAAQYLLDTSELLATCLVFQVSGKLRSPSGKQGREVESSYVFEAVVSEPSLRHEGTRAPLLNHYLHIHDLADVVVMGRSFQVQCSYYCQQNEITSSCAHSALKVASWHLNGNYQVPNRFINNAAAKLAPEGFIPGNGLHWSQIQAVAEELDLNLVFTDFEGDKRSDISPYELAYLFVESNLPTFIVFRTSDSRDGVDPSSAEYHVVPVFGHTVSTDEWLPAALRTYKRVPTKGLAAPNSYLMSSVEWVPQLIIHDDLLGPYMKIGPNSLTRKALPDDGYQGRACKVAALVPPHLGDEWSPIIAQQFGCRLFLREFFRAGTLAELSDEMNALVGRWPTPIAAARDAYARTQLLREPYDYYEHIKSQSSKSDFKRISTRLKTVLAQHEGEGVWLIEISVPELFCGNRSKIGDVLLPFSAASLTMLSRCGSDKAPAPLAVRTFDFLRINDGMVGGPVNLGGPTQGRILSITRHSEAY